MKKLALLLGIAVTMAAGQAMAQTYRHELSAYGNWTHLKESGQTRNVSIQDVDYGYYLTPQFLATIGVTRVSTDGFGYTDIGIGGKYYFGIARRGSFLPFLDGQIGTEKSGTNKDRRWQLGGGFSYFVTEATSFDTGLHWFKVSTDPAIFGTIIGVGFSTRF